MAIPSWKEDIWELVKNTVELIGCVVVIIKLGPKVFKGFKNLFASFRGMPA